jgi:hypothetical protein
VRLVYTDRKTPTKEQSLKRIGIAIVFAGSMVVLMGQTRQGATPWYKETLQTGQSKPTEWNSLQPRDIARASLYENTLGGSEFVMFDEHGQTT